ncbi:MAG: hypothetical protein BUE48_023360 [Thermomonospora sp. CIF 1]|nr:MAG: hypothetical protein BUE48_023360 [Thermomonospora sp. CIF 1]
MPFTAAVFCDAPTGGLLPVGLPALLLRPPGTVPDAVGGAFTGGFLLPGLLAGAPLDAIRGGSFAPCGAFTAGLPLLGLFVLPLQPFGMAADATGGGSVALHGTLAAGFSALPLRPPGASLGVLGNGLITGSPGRTVLAS